jgi:hypothetical protein
MAFAETLQRAYKSAVFDGFLLERAERVVKSYPPAGQERLRAMFDAGNRRSTAAADLLESQPRVAAILYRDAATLFIGAILAVRDGDSSFGPGDVEIAFEKLEAVRSELPPAPANLDRARSLLSDPDPLAFDRLSDSEAALGVAAVAATINWLHDAIEPRTVAEIRRSRVLRLSLAGAAVLALLVWLGFLVFTPTNIARGKTVTASSRHPNSTAAEGGLTDGTTMSGYGVHTNYEDNPWVRVDLGAVYKLKKVKVYNRADGWQDSVLPLTLEVSEDGVNFKPVDHRTTAFSQWSPWVYSAQGEKARYIQVHGAKGNYVALSELEAFGKK